jgi:hypothetical protein
LIQSIAAQMHECVSNSGCNIGPRQDLHADSGEVHDHCREANDVEQHRSFEKIDEVPRGFRRRFRLGAALINLKVTRGSQALAYRADPRPKKSGEYQGGEDYHGEHWVYHVNFLVAPDFKKGDMFSVVREVLPSDALILTYGGGAHPERWGNYADCFAVHVRRNVALSDFVFAFYTSRLFRIEALILRIALGAPSGKTSARALADGRADKFAAWYVAQRTETQLLMCDRYERTRSWFRVVPLAGGGTQLLFGSALAKSDVQRAGTQQKAHSPQGFRLLLWFHVVYSQALLRCATANLGV